MKISRNELLLKYGINLPKGLYRIQTNADYYSISTVKDDTSGCIIVGKNKVVGKVLESRATFTMLMKDYLLPAKQRKESVYITIL